MKLTRPLLKKLVMESIFDTQDALAHATKHGESSAHVPLTREQAMFVQDLIGRIGELENIFSDINYPANSEGDAKLPSMKFGEFVTYLENLLLRGTEGN